ncbi:uncharacterized protein K444DRAFT_227581 [Hyaloscypha bicolor E]|uniref:Uncharacterized protein n=1 Tax=Hyaloscypha bicolor E TaxID=1095630 RepID=A0A2J6SKD5_9HELO|nr:uncharacterized protein K444DRAFT_227581 [Hyaloscypha bicolor E]PMD51226.1 hypothetical protein K444DRAFT_227581 [Hyaloscypha bicolor E]
MSPFLKPRIAFLPTRCGLGLPASWAIPNVFHRSGLRSPWAAEVRSIVNAGLDESDPVAAPIVVVFDDAHFDVLGFSSTTLIMDDIFPRCEDDQVKAWLVCCRV